MLTMPSLAFQLIIFPSCDAVLKLPPMVFEICLLHAKMFDLLHVVVDVTPKLILTNKHVILSCNKLGLAFCDNLPFFKLSLMLSVKMLGVLCTTPLFSVCDRTVAFKLLCFGMLQHSERMLALCLLM